MPTGERINREANSENKDLTPKKVERVERMAVSETHVAAILKKWRGIHMEDVETWRKLAPQKRRQQRTKR